MFKNQCNIENIVLQILTVINCPYITNNTYPQKNHISKILIDLIIQAILLF